MPHPRQLRLLRKAQFGLPRKAAALLGLDRTQDQPFSWRTLHHSRFRLYFLGSVTSDFGTWLQNTAQVLLAYHLAHSAFAVGLVTCAQFSSPLVLGPFAGVMADRFGGRKTLLGTQIASAMIALALAILEFCGLLSEWTLVAGALLSGLAFTFALPARNVIVRRLVPENETRPAYVMDAVSYNLGRATAPPLSVLLILVAGYGWVFAANSLTFIIFTITLIRAKTDTPEPEVRSKVRDGFVIARNNRLILFLLLMVAAVTIADDPVLVLGPALASKLHVSANWSGWFIAALGGGSVLGSLRRPRHLPTLRLASTSLACLGVCMVCFVSIPWVWASFFAALGAGVSCLFANSMTRTLLSQEAGKKQAGAVMAVFAIAWTGSKPLASLLDGLAAGRFGVRTTGILFAIPAFVPLACFLIKLYVVPLWARFGSAHPQPVPQHVLAAPPLQPALYAQGGRRPALAMFSVLTTLLALVVLSPLSTLSIRLETIASVRRRLAIMRTRRRPAIAPVRPVDVLPAEAPMLELTCAAGPALPCDEHAGIHAFGPELGGWSASDEVPRVLALVRPVHVRKTCGEVVNDALTGQMTTKLSGLIIVGGGRQT
jgi:MFS family permease